MVSINLTMKNLNQEDDVGSCALKALEQGFKLYDLKLVPGKNSLRIRVFLDKLDDPWGTPNVADCEKFARAFDAGLTDLVNMGKLSENYILEVSSPGAERELKSSEEWGRFKDKPMKVRYNITPVKANTDVFSLIRIDGDMTYWKKARLKKDKNNNKEKPDKETGILIKDIIQVKLYLDF
jgi:ribosome maturation factor RimP